MKLNEDNSNDDMFDTVTSVSRTPVFDLLSSPMPRLHAQYAPGTKAWAESRELALGSSEIASVMGHGRYDSAFSLFHKKRDPERYLEEIKNDALLEWGHRLEPVIAEKLLDVLKAEYPNERLSIADLQNTYSHPERPWQLSSPDRFLSVSQDVTGSCAGHSDTLLKCNTAHYKHDLSAPIELKAPLYVDEWGPSMSTGYPFDYYIQCQQHISVFNAKGAWLAAFIRSEADNPFRVYWIPRDDSLIGDMIHLGQKFIDSLTSGELPNVDGHEETLKVVRKIHPDIEDREVEISEDDTEDWLAAKIGIDKLETRQRYAAAKILQTMGKAKYGVVDGKRIIRRQASPHGGAPHLRSTARKKKAQ